MYYFGEPGELFLYDSTNGYLYLGWALDFIVKEKALYHKTIEGQKRGYNNDLQMSASLGRSNQTLLDDIRARKNIKQTVYFTGLLSATKIANIYVTAEQDRKSGANAELHTLKISGSTNEVSDVTQYVNLLNKDGSFEADSNSDGAADGWIDGATNASIVASFLSGAGNAQRINLAAAGDSFKYKINAPFTGRRRISAHVNIKEYTGTGAAGFVYGFRTLDSSGTVISTYSDSYNLAAGSTTHAKKEVRVDEGEPVYSIELFFEHTGSGGEIVLDNCMVNFGNYLDFVNN